MNEEGEDRGKDGEAKVLADEDGVVREEGGIEGELDAGDVEAAVLGERMIAVEEKREGGECDHDKAHRPGRKRVGGQGWGGTRCGSHRVLDLTIQPNARP